MVHIQGFRIHAVIPVSLVGAFKNKFTEGGVYRIHKFAVKEYVLRYRPLHKDIFMHFYRHTVVCRSHIPAAAFDRYSFDFVPFAMLSARLGDVTYLSGYILILG